MIAKELEHSYGGIGDDFSWPMKRISRSSASAERAVGLVTLPELGPKKEE
jgi:hypothetical protein